MNRYFSALEEESVVGLWRLKLEEESVAEDGRGESNDVNGRCYRDRKLEKTASASAFSITGWSRVFGPRSELRRI